LNMYLMSDELALTAIIGFVMLADFMKAGKKQLGWMFFLSLSALFVFVLLNPREGAMFGGAYIYDRFAWFSKLVFLLAAAFTAFLSIDTIRVKDRHAGAYYAILGASTLGMMFLASSKELITMYVGLELATVSLFALTAIYKDDELSLEAGIKYVILGALSSGILLYGISLVYGATGTTYIEGIMSVTAQAQQVSPLMIFGILLMLLGIGFKLSMVPMHVWTPDVYQGAPTQITAFISVASKAAGFVFALRMFMYAFIKFEPLLVPAIAVLAFLTMTVGNLIAIPQKNLKRMLAYSSISQAGYLLVGFVGGAGLGISSVMFYMLAYVVTNLTAFGVLIVFANSTGSDELDDYSGLAQTQPVVALTLMLALLSLAGIPPLVGFTGKVYLFYAAMQKGYAWLVVAGALNSTVSLYYYLLVLKRMYMWDKTKELPKISVPATVTAALIILSVLMLVLGIFPGPVMDITIEAAQKLFSAAA